MGTASNSDCGVVLRTGEYDTAFHIGGLFIIFVAGLCGSILPVMSKYFNWLDIRRPFMKVFNAFGIGVVIATAFIHMIPPAILQLNSECISISQEYNGFAMVIVLVTVLVMQYIENELVIYFTKSIDNNVPILRVNNDCTVEVSPTLPSTVQYSPNHNVEFQILSNETFNDHLSQYQLHTKYLHDTKQALRTKITVIIFELGVAMHSIIIGIDLGVISGNEFNTLLIALSLHQFFEGIAVGTSAVIGFPNIKSVVLTVAAYSCTTPLGVVIGIAISGAYSATTPTTLWLRGILDAISAGILIYTGIVELLTYQLTMNHDFHHEPAATRHLVYFSLYLGGGAMAIVGKYT